MSLHYTGGLPSRAQKRGFCALFGFETPVFGLFEHKIGIFVRFLPSKPPFSGFSSTKSRFLCAFGVWNPCFQAFQAQNRGFCAFLGSGTLVFGHFEHKMVLRQISCCQVKQVWKILIQRRRSEARPYILLLIYFILLFSPSISPLLIEYFMAFLMGEMSRWTLFTKLTTSP